MRELLAAGILCASASVRFQRRLGFKADCEWRARFRHGNTFMAQPNRNCFYSKQYGARGFLPNKCAELDWSADSVSAACTDVIQPDRLLPLGREIQSGRLERVFCSFVIPFFACPQRLLEWRIGDHTGSDSECGRITSGRDRIAANNGIVAGTRLP